MSTEPSTWHQQTWPPGGATRGSRDMLLRLLGIKAANGNPSSPPTKPFAGPSPGLERLRDAMLKGRRDDQANRMRHIRALQPGSDLYRRVVACGENDGYGGTLRCNRPPCPRCARRQAWRQFYKTVLPAFGTTQKDRLRFVTVIQTVTTELDTIRTTVAKQDRALRHRLNKMIGLDPRWASVRLMGWREIEVHRDTDLPSLGVRTQATLQALDFPRTQFGEAAYVVHWHAIVDCGQVNPGAVVALMREQWSAHPNQIDARSLWARRSVENNLKHLTMYSNKFRLCRDAGGGREPLDKEEVANLVNWYASLGRGFQWFRFAIGMRRRVAGCDSSDTSSLNQANVDPPTVSPMSDDDRVPYPSPTDCGRSAELTLDTSGRSAAAAVDQRLTAADGLDSTLPSSPHSSGTQSRSEACTRRSLLILHHDTRSPELSQHAARRGDYCDFRSRAPPA